MESISSRNTQRLDTASIADARKVWSGSIFSRSGLMARLSSQSPVVGRVPRSQGGRNRSSCAVQCGRSGPIED